MRKYLQNFNLNNNLNDKNTQNMHDLLPNVSRRKEDGEIRTETPKLAKFFLRKLRSDVSILIVYSLHLLNKK